MKNEEWPWEKEDTARRINTKEWPWLNQNYYSHGETNIRKSKRPTNTPSIHTENWPWDGKGVRTIGNTKYNRRKWNEKQWPWNKRTTGFVKNGIMEGKENLIDLQLTLILSVLPDPSVSGPVVVSDGEEAFYVCKMSTTEIIWSVTSFSGADVPFLTGLTMNFV